jgi:hypothetical protein
MTANDKLEKAWKKPVVASFKETIPAMIEKNKKKTSVEIVCLKDLHLNQRPTINKAGILADLQQRSMLDDSV